MPIRLLLFLFFAVLAGAAQASDTFETDHGSVRLMSAATAVGDEKTLLLGLHWRMSKNWKIYWRAPGDAGFPPKPDWEGSENLENAEILWPAPERFSVLGIDTIGYKDEALLPVRATIRNPGQALKIRAVVDYLTCDDICVPYTAELALDIPAGPVATSPDAHLIGQWVGRVPGDGTAHGLAIEGAWATDKILTVTAKAQPSFKAPDLFVEGTPDMLFGPPRVELRVGGARAVVTVSIDEGKVAGQPLIFTLVDGARSAERKLDAQAGSPPTSQGETPFAAILALAVLGGLILNLMPCVLPVLSIKLLGVVGHGGGDKRLVRLSFVASAGGIIGSFLALAGALAGLKAAGALVGWGIQFQHSWFLAALILVVVLFACNLWGFFEVRLPMWVSDVGEHASHVHGLGGHFLQGALATLLATPCSAPFLGTAVGFALARGTGEILAVFAALGLGLALPYLLVAAFPGMATRLPKPGMWMVRLRQVMGVALAGTALWLLSVLAVQAGANAGLAVAALAVALCVVLYFKQVWAAIAVAALMIAAPAVTEGTGGGSEAKSDFWKPFDQAAIPALVADGKVVFVDVTAEWCITCQVNKAVVLSRGEVAKRLSGDGVVAMQADWTRPDEAIARYLASFGRYGIPFDAVYGPAAPDGRPLPELLTEGVVMEALDAAR